MDRETRSSRRKAPKAQRRATVNWQQWAGWAVEVVKLATALLGLLRKS